MTDFTPRTDRHSYHELTVEDVLSNTKAHQKEEYLRGLYFIEGLSQREIADEYEVDVSTINYWFDKHGIETDPVVDDDENAADRGDV